MRTKANNRARKVVEKAVGSLASDMERLSGLLDRLDAGTEYDDCSKPGHVCVHDDARDLFRKVFLVHDYVTDGNRKVGTIQCGSFRTKTASALYRLLYLTEPKRIDLSDMYKSCSLMCLTSPDGRFCADPQFYKYELAIYLSGAEGCVQGQEHGVTCGVPGSDNGIGIADVQMKDWARLLKRCLTRKWDVYPGNDFKV